jgi:hypothetical protein
MVVTLTRFSTSAQNDGMGRAHLNREAAVPGGGEDERTEGDPGGGAEWCDSDPEDWRAGADLAGVPAVVVDVIGGRGRLVESDRRRDGSRPSPDTGPTAGELRAEDAGES